MAGLKITVPGSYWEKAGWATGAALVRKNFVGTADRAYWIDPSDQSTLFQDRAGTSPVTAPGDPVRRVLDKSGQGRDMVLSEGAADTPTYQTDGFRHWIDVPLGAPFEIDTSLLVTEPRTAVAAVRFTGGEHSTRRSLYRQEGDATNSIVILQVQRLNGVLEANLEGTAGFELQGEQPFSDGDDVVISYINDPSIPLATLRLNGSVDASEAYSPSSFGGRQSPTIIFPAYSNNHTSGRIYGLAFVNTSRDVEGVEGIFAQKAGISL